MLLCISRIVTFKLILFDFQVSAPVWNAITFLHVFTEGREINFGVFGFTGSRTTVGYTFDPSVLGLSK